MNLSYGHKLLMAAEQQGRGFLQTRGQRANHEVRLMAEAGLVDATLCDGKVESFTTINRVTDLGRKFLRTFKGPRIPAPVLRGLRKPAAAEWQADTHAAVLVKWNANFALDLRRPARVDESPKVQACVPDTEAS